MNEMVKVILDAVNTCCIKRLVISRNNPSDHIVDEFMELCLGFEPFYCLMPTRLESFLDSIHSNQNLRDFTFDMVENAIFGLKTLDEQSDGFERIVNIISQTMVLTKDKAQLSPSAFKATISLDSYKLVGIQASVSGEQNVKTIFTQNPLLVLFYVVSQNITNLDIFNTLYLTDSKKGN